LIQRFEIRFGEHTTKPLVFFSPGRINLIGEHLDYNGGFVLPCALSLGTYLTIRLRDDGQLKLYSENFDSSFEISLENINGKAGDRWWNYPLGVVDEFNKLSKVEQGFEMLFSGDLPIGAGLSSSASIEVATAFAINRLLKRELPLKEIAQLAQRAENNFVGVRCGIMDQYAVAFGKEDHAIFLDCSSISHEYVQATLQGFSFIIADTNKSRSLDSSAFNMRYEECRVALKTMQRLLFVNEIAEATPEQFESIEHWFPDEISRNRARHLVFENQRVKEASVALPKRNIMQLAALMNESHASLRDNYDVSCNELESLVRASQDVNGCHGSRISGAGFGGCTINLVANDAEKLFENEVAKSYFNSTGLVASFYKVQIGNGVHEIS
jgi:galactokinase